jgi:hypothetical protein
LSSRNDLGSGRALAARIGASWRGLLVFVLVAAASAGAIPRDEPTVEELKMRIASANPSDRARLCVQIAQKQIDETDKLYAADDVEKAQPALTDVVTYSELARDYAIQSHKHQKQTEIAVRSITRKLNGLLHTLAQDQQAPIRDALKRLDRVRDDLLASMFKKGEE